MTKPPREMENALVSCTQEQVTECAREWGCEVSVLECLADKGLLKVDQKGRYVLLSEEGEIVWKRRECKFCGMALAPKKPYFYVIKGGKESYFCSKEHYVEWLRCS